MGKFCSLIAVAIFCCQAETPAEFAARVRAAMAQSLDQQRASVQKQTAAALPVAPIAPMPTAGFFTTPWPEVPFNAPPKAYRADCEPVATDKLDAMVDDAAKREGVQPELIQAVIERESAARPCAISVKGAQGLMQLMPATAGDLGVKDPFDPKQNVDAGTKLLKQLLTKYNGDVSLALGAYNAGSARVDREGGIPSIPETINYVSDILSKVTPKQ
ncbi:MAG TPA: lytic transglycosylase domain-containing protein [Bryobacteraceae bacterium]|nr:lytic transglycosylase domain-containing protein [Bryobacteraceae bacterium]